MSLESFLALRLGPASARTVTPKLVERGVDSEELLWVAVKHTDLVAGLSPFLAATVRAFGPYQQRFPGGRAQYRATMAVAVSVVVNCVLGFAFAWSSFSWFGYFSSAALLATAAVAVHVLLHHVDADYVFKSRAAMGNVMWIKAALKVTSLVTLMGCFAALALGVYLVTIARLCLPCAYDEPSCYGNTRPQACQPYMDPYSPNNADFLINMRTYGVLSLVTGVIWAFAGVEGCLVGSWLGGVARQ